MYAINGPLLPQMINQNENDREKGKIWAMDAHNQVNQMIRTIALYCTQNDYESIV